MKSKLSKRSKEMSHDMYLGCKKDKEGVKGDDSQNSDTMESEELRLVLIGNTGSGKSASGNTILGKKHFLSKMSPSSVTQTCQLETTELAEEAQRDGGAVTQKRMRRVVVVDTPGFGDTHLNAEAVHDEVAKCVSLSAPGPHAFLLVVPIGRYTEDQDKAVCEFTKIFRDESVWLHTLVLFTRGDDLEGTTIEDFLQTAPRKLQALVDRCGGRYHVFNNKDPSNSVQVKELINKVEKMAKQTNTGFYTNPIFSEAEAAIREEQKNILRKRGQARRKEQGENNSNSREEQAEPNGQHNSGSSNSSSSGSSRQQSSSWFSLRLESALSPTVLNRIKILVVAAATGAALGAVFGAGVGVIMTTATGTSATALGAQVGAVVGGLVGFIVGSDSATPQEAATHTVEQVGSLGATALVEARRVLVSTNVVAVNVNTKSSES